jgi:hypothetical protein
MADAIRLAYEARYAGENRHRSAEPQRLEHEPLSVLGEREPEQGVLFPVCQSGRSRTE